MPLKSSLAKQGAKQATATTTTGEPRTEGGEMSEALLGILIVIVMFWGGCISSLLYCVLHAVKDKS